MSSRAVDDRRQKAGEETAVEDRDKRGSESGERGGCEELAAYFKARPAFARIFAAMQKKWESLGKTAGKVVLSHASDEERRALERFLGIPMPEGQIRFTLPGFEQALKETRYGQVSLKELLEAYFGVPLVGSQEKKQDKKDREERFWDDLEKGLQEELERAPGKERASRGELEGGPGEEPEAVRGPEKEEETPGEQAKSRAAVKEVLGWIREMREQKSGGYVTLMKEYRRSEEAAKELVWQVARCLAFCRAGGIRLAVLAAKVTTDPHALDRQNTAGTLLSWALCRRDGSAFPQNAREWKALYERNGIWIDELSSTVIAYGIHLLVEEVDWTGGADGAGGSSAADRSSAADGAGGSSAADRAGETDKMAGTRKADTLAKGPALSIHPAYEGYCQRKEPCVLSLANLGHARKAYGDSRNIYIVENEMVFSELLERLSRYPVTLLCTSGQPRTAAYRLLELLGESGHHFYYAGDLDPEGLDIAERLWRSFPDHVQIWRMGAEDYEKAMSGETVSERRVEMLKGLTHPELKKTAEQLSKYRRAGYQEMLLEEMVEDVVDGVDKRPDRAYLISQLRKPLTDIQQTNGKRYRTRGGLSGKAI